MKYLGKQSLYISVNCDKTVDVESHITLHALTSDFQTTNSTSELGSTEQNKMASVIKTNFQWNNATDRVAGDDLKSWRTSDWSAISIELHVMDKL